MCWSKSGCNVKEVLLSDHYKLQVLLLPELLDILFKQRTLPP